MENLVELRTTEHKNIYEVTYNGKEYICNLYYRDDNCGSFQEEIFDKEGNEIEDKKLFEEIRSIVFEYEDEQTIDED